MTLEEYIAEDKANGSMKEYHVRTYPNYMIELNCRECYASHFSGGKGMRHSEDCKIEEYREARRKALYDR